MVGKTRGVCLTRATQLSTLRVIYYRQDLTGPDSRRLLRSLHAVLGHSATLGTCMSSVAEGARMYFQARTRLVVVTCTWLRFGVCVPVRPACVVHAPVCVLFVLR